jgi:rhodanese-related sulfurtransferase
MSPARISVDEVKKLMEQGTPITFVDSRNPEAWAASSATLPGCVRVPADAVDRNIQKLSKDRMIITYCT